MGIPRFHRGRFKLAIFLPSILLEIGMFSSVFSVKEILIIIPFFWEHPIWETIKKKQKVVAGVGIPAPRNY